MAVHWSLRQIELHFAYYYYWRTVLAAQLSDKNTNSNAADLAQESSGGLAELPPKDKLKVELLTNDRFSQTFTQKDIRMNIRNKEAFSQVKTEAVTPGL